MDLNRASVNELIRLPGVGRATAKRIIEGRPYRRLADVRRVSGVGDDLIHRIHATGAFVGRPKVRSITLEQDGEIEGVERPVGYIFDEDGAFLTEFTPGRGQVKVPETVAGKSVNVWVGDREVDSPNVAKLERGGFEVRRLPMPLERRHLDLGYWKIDPKWLKRSCCHVRGRVLKHIVLPNGSSRKVPLCHARVEICEVDKSPRHLIEALPIDHVARLKAELIDLGTVRDRDTGPIEVGASPDLARRQKLRAVEPSPELTTLVAGLQTTPGLAAVRDLLLDRVLLLKPWWCYFDWLTWNYQLECVKTVPLNADGTFSTDITYACYGDKPDLYFRVQQECHGDGWTTVHAPNVACSTQWNYCCGDHVEITVTNTAAAHASTPGGYAIPFDTGDPASVGEWASLPDSEVFVVHANVLRSGKVLLFSGGTEAQLPLESRVWDPATGTLTTQTFADDLFCAHQVALADGRILVMGGSFYQGPHGKGIKATYTFDPVAETWTKQADMAFGRWYPTAVLMPDGQALTFSGRDAGASVVEEVESFNPATNTWTQLPGSADKELEIYPSMHLLKDGTVFYTGCRWQGSSGRAWLNPPDTARFHPATNSWTDVGPHVIPNRTEGTSVLLPPHRAGVPHGHEDEGPLTPSDQRVLVLGGEGADPGERASAEIIDMNEAAPAWRRIADMHHRRVNPNAVILADRTVLVVGGVAGFKFDASPSPALAAELFDSVTETWTELATMTNPRHYHSIATLLPDGRVLVTGTTSYFGNDQSVEVYSPPYLFRGPRPRITGYPATAGYGDEIEIDSPDACRVVDAVLIRPGSLTHHTDSDQRLVSLDILEKDHCWLRFGVPANPALAPPGYYMLFLIDDYGVPSEAKFVRIG